ncbi:MAG: NAD(P)-dependent oxidoreductase [Acidimicrobiia bacterium]
MSHAVFVTGATGVLGRATVPRLLVAGWSVTAVARSDAAADALRAAGAQPIAVDLFDTDAVAAALAGHTAVMHLATSIPPLARMRKRDAWVTNDRLRVDATRHLLAAARVHGIDRFVKESITYPYLDGGERWLDEDAPLDPAEAWRATLSGEELVREYAAEGGSGVVLRFGALYAPDARSTEEYRTLARRHMAPFPGRAEAFVSSIHADDAATALCLALDVPAGTYNVVDDRPVRRREYAEAFAAAFGTPRLHLVPGGVTRALGGDGARGLAASQRVTNAAFRAVTGWMPVWTDACIGWEAIAKLTTEEGP